MNQFVELDWNQLKSLTPPVELEEWGIPFARILNTPEGRCFSQIDKCTFVETTELSHFRPGQSGLYVSCFYWAPTIAALRRAALYEMNSNVQSNTLPPLELLLAPNCVTFKDVVERAERGASDRFAIHIWHKEGNWHNWFNKTDGVMRHHAIQSKDEHGNRVPFLGRSVRVEKIEYYFAGEDDPMESVFAIGLNTDDSSWDVVG